MKRLKAIKARMEARLEAKYGSRLHKPTPTTPKPIKQSSYLYVKETFHSQTTNEEMLESKISWKKQDVTTKEQPFDDNIAGDKPNCKQHEYKKLGIHVRLWTSSWADLKRSQNWRREPTADQNQRQRKIVTTRRLP